MTKLSVAAPAPSLRYQPYVAYYAALDAWRRRSPEPLRSSILVAGAPRSGTTWVANIVARLAGGWPLLDEPTHAHRVPEMRDGHAWGARAFREPEAADPELAADLERLLTGTYLGSGIVGRSRAIDGALWRRSPVVAKVIDCHLILPWIATSLPWLRTVHVVRHPLAVVASQEARAGSIWSTQRTLSQSYQQFMAAHPEYAGPTEFESVPACLLSGWAIEHAWLRDRAAELGSLIPVRYEELRADLGGEAARLAAALGLPAPGPEIVDQLVAPSRAVVDAAASTLGTDAHSGWRARYDDACQAELREILERYGWPFYGPEAF